LDAIYLTVLLLYSIFIAAMHAGLKRLMSPAGAELPRLSVILPVRNEQNHIAACLASLAQQTYPKELYEVTVIDDESSDGTAEQVEQWCRDHPNFQLVRKTTNAAFNGSPKKRAIQLGIEHSVGDLIITTDADCRFSKNWLRCMAAAFSAEIGAVASWVHVPANGTLLSRVEELDSMSYSLVGAACIALGYPILANGANFAYRRQAYDQIGGFQGIDCLASGDDDLLLQKLHQQGRWRIGFSDSSETIVTTRSCTGWKAFFQQRVRWASKSGVYKESVQAVLFVLFVLMLCYLSSLIMLIAQPTAARAALVVGKMVADYTLLRVVARKFGTTFRLSAFLTAELVQAIYLPAIALWGALVGSFEWKDRRYRHGRIDAKNHPAKPIPSLSIPEPDHSMAGKLAQK